MIKKIMLGSVLALMTFSFVGCKKGENDPFLSLRSRKARLAGDWTLTKIEGTEQSYFNGTLVSTTTYSGDGSTITVTEDGDVNSSSYTHEFTFEKKGSYSSLITNNGATFTSSGHWTFMGKSKSADLKSKESIVLSELSYKEVDGEYSFTDISEGFVIDDYYLIDRLTNKELVLKSLYDASNSDGDKQTANFTLTFKAK